MKLIFDCETSGFKESRLLQLACILKDADFKDVAAISLLVRPTFDIEPGAQAVHGISKEKAMTCGLPIEVVVAVFCGLASKAKMFVGHNLEFDMGVVEGEMRRLGWPVINKERFCTKEAMTGVCKLPPTEKMKRAGRRGFKSPKLIEAYRFAFGKDFESAHDAMADCRATAELFEWIKNPPPVVVTSEIVPPMVSKMADALLDKTRTTFFGGQQAGKTWAMQIASAKDVTPPPVVTFQPPPPLPTI